jgi:tyrosyl-tRNA synthetase
MPLLEGLDGIQKMSKSLGNYIGITEPPREMFGKVMSISDELMWRYYELLTDVSMSEIKERKRSVAQGKAHPMAMKKELGRRLVTDFHSAEAALRAAEEWEAIFQRDQAPENLEHVSVAYAEVAAKGNGAEKAIKLDKLLARCGLAESVSDGLRKIKQNSVRIDGDVRNEPILQVQLPADFVLRVGRLLKRVTIAG